MVTRRLGVSRMTSKPHSLGGAVVGVLCDEPGPRERVLAVIRSLSGQAVVVAAAGDVETTMTALTIRVFVVDLNHPTRLDAIMTALARGARVVAMQHGMVSQDDRALIDTRNIRLVSAMDPAALRGALIEALAGRRPTHRLDDEVARLLQAWPDEALCAPCIGHALGVSPDEASAVMGRLVISSPRYRQALQRCANCRRTVDALAWRRA
jgi:hypothetical protein